MNLFQKLGERAETGKLLRVGLIGAGKFGSMFLAQMLRVPGIHVVGIADLNPETARSNLALVGWPEERYSAETLDGAAKMGTTWVGADAAALISHPQVEIVIEATGHPLAAVDHCLKAFANGKNVINVTGGGCVLRLWPCAKGRRKWRHLQHGLWRPTGAHKRSGRLGADLRFYRYRCWSWPQMVAPISNVHAGYGLGSLGADA